LFVKNFWSFCFFHRNQSRADPEIGVPFASVSERGECAQEIHQRQSAKISGFRLRSLRRDEEKFRVVRVIRG
jgi:hypothetical protein